MAETPKREHVGIFNPLILPLPNWHPDGPDGEVDGYRIPFVFPTDRESGRPANRDAYLRVYPTPHGWRSALLNCQDHAETAAQARAFAGAWIRAAELLDAEVLRAAERRKREAEAAGDDDVVDAEVVEDDEDQDVTVHDHAAGEPAPTDWATTPDNPDGSCASCGAHVDHEHATDCAAYLAQLRGGKS